MKVQINVNPSEAQLNKLQSVSNELEFINDLNDTSAEILIGDYKADILKNYSNLKLLISTSVGYDAYIKKGVLKDDVTLCNAVDIHTEEVAEHLFTLMVSTVKNLNIYRDNQKKHLWHDEGPIKSLLGLRVCIIGLGDIGSYLAKMCHSLGMYVIGVKRKAIKKPDYVDELYLNDQLDEAISDVDVVVSIIPGSKENTHLFDIERFKKMKPDTILINGGRGNLIDSDVLYEVLDKKIIKAIASDVFEIEPLPKESKLYDLDNLILTPHMAGFFHLAKAKEKFIDMCKLNLENYLNHKPLINVVKEREQ